jgi:hypothetical protein
VDVKGFLFVTALVCGGAGSAAASWSECDHRAPREATVATAGARRIQVVARAGDLRIQGREGATAVGVKGTACASTESRLSGIRLIAERRGDVVYVEADIPQASMGGAAGLDLSIDVPASIPLNVEDGSGSAQIRGVAALEIDDGSGELLIEDVAGEVIVSDGSGDIDIRHAGSVVVKDDGSGSVRAAGVRGDVVVRDDGSGSIDVSDVGGDFTVDKDGSGGIAHDGVRGQVRIPRKR